VPSVDTRELFGLQPLFTMELREQLGHALGNTFTLGREIGSSGVSRVFIAEDGRLRGNVVVKVLDPSRSRCCTPSRVADD